MPSKLSANGRWTDEHFRYDYQHDWYSPRKNIERGDGAILYDVSEIKEGAKYTVHFCPKARQIWVVDVAGLRNVIWFTRDWKIAYCPSSVEAGPVSARGYLVSCELIKEFGHCFPMPENLAQRFLKAKTKAEAGNVAEKAFEWLVNDRAFFPAILDAPARRSGQQDDICGGIDFWVAGDLPIQVKFDGPGGTNCTGNLFFQTHTLPLRQQQDWHGYEY